MIDGRRVPDRAAGRPHQAPAAALVRPGRGQGVGLPDQPAGGRVQRLDAAAEGAAGIGGGGGRTFLDRGDGHVEAPAIEHRRAGDPRRGMGVGLDPPDLPPAVGVDGVDPAGHVAEVGHRASAALADHKGGPDGGRRLEIPEGAAAGRVQGVDVPAARGDEHAAAHHRRLAPGHQTRIGEGPLQLQAGNLGRGETRRGLEPGVGEVAAPAVPCGPGGLHRGRGAGAGIGMRRLGPGRALGGEIAGHRRLVGRRQPRRHRLHGPGGEGHQHVGRAAAGQGLVRGRVAGRVVVAAGASLLEDRRPVRSRRGLGETLSGHRQSHGRHRARGSHPNAHRHPPLALVRRQGL